MRRVFLLTGATGAIGGGIARGLARQPDGELVLAVRDLARGQAFAEALRRESGNDAIRCELLDVASGTSIAALAERFSGPLSVLVNNAAIAPGGRLQNDEGVELQFATNVLGYQRLTTALLPILEATAPARVVNVASYWAGGLDLDDLQFERRRYHNDAAYRQSKQANRMLSVAWAERLGDLGVSVNACHPGDVDSRLSRDLGFGGPDSAEQGARTPLLLATEATLEGTTGLYFARGKPADCEFSRDREAIERLFEIVSRF